MYYILPTDLHFEEKKSHSQPYGYHTHTKQYFIAFSPLSYVTYGYSVFNFNNIIIMNGTDIFERKPHNLPLSFSVYNHHSASLVRNS